jgi:RHS repeat-associated protein
MVRSGASYYYHDDHLGNIRVLTDANENIVATYQYDAFGTIIQETGSVNNPYRFTGREWDVESGLYYYRARYYDAVFGRFMQKDPEGLKEGINLYSYVGNNHINFKDPTGRKWRCGRYFWYPKWVCKGWNSNRFYYCLSNIGAGFAFLCLMNFCLFVCLSGIGCWGCVAMCVAGIIGVVIGCIIYWGFGCGWQWQKICVFWYYTWW